MAQQGFAQTLKSVLDDARELSGLWTNTAIADKLDVEIEALERGVENGDAEEVTYVLLPALRETVEYANKELQRVEG